MNFTLMESFGEVSVNHIHRLLMLQALQDTVPVGKQLGQGGPKLPKSVLIFRRGSRTSRWIT